VRVAEGVYQRIDAKTGRRVPDKFEYTYRNETGRQVWRTASGTTRTDARNERREQLGMVRRSDKQPCELTVGEVARLWLVRGVGSGGRWEASTYRRYEEHVAGLIERSVDPALAAIGDVKLVELTVDRVAIWSEANQRLRAVNTAGHALGHLHQICQYAVRQGWLAENPVTRLERHERPSGPRQRAVVLTGPELGRLLEHAGSLRLLFEFMAYTGLRVGETVGLRWRDVDLAVGVAHVEQQLGRDRAPKRLKTPAGRRDVVLGDTVVSLLHELEEAATHTGPDDLVFCTSAGRGRCPKHVSDAFTASVRRAALTGDGRICLHGLRHRYASMLIGAGIDVVYVARQLGHSDPRITLSTYAHYFAAADHATAAKAAIDRHHHARSLEPAMETAVETETPI
jgi:integrase